MKDLLPYLQQQADAGLYRQRKVIQSAQKIHVQSAGDNFINFCSNDYLGLANHPRVIHAFKVAADEYGVGSGASQLICGYQTPHYELELALADFLGWPRVLLFSSGYLANLGVVSALCERKDPVYQDRLNHASLLDASVLARAQLLRYPHRDTHRLQKMLEQRRLSGMIISDGVFSMDGDEAPLAQLVALAHQHQLLLMIDDAHGIGVMGENGRGSVAGAGYDSSQVPVLTGTLGKALGSAGAFVAADEAIIETCIQRARTLIYSTALPAAVAAATLSSLQVMQDESWRRERLQENIKCFTEAAMQAGLPMLESGSAIQPVMIGASERATRISEQLRQRGYLVSAIRAPTVPAGSERLRVTLCAEHEKEHIRELISTIQELL